MENTAIKAATARCDNIKFPFIRLLKREQWQEAGSGKHRNSRLT